MSNNKGKKNQPLPWDDDPLLDTGAGWTKGTFAPRCYETHKGLVLPSGHTIYGGSCSSPIVDADIYVGLDYSQTAQCPYPWETGGGSIIDVRYLIPDMQAPTRPESFAGMVSWLDAQVRAGKRVHVGCIGGHGRTGTVLAALVAVQGEKDAVRYVRERYCDKAVETETQITFLVNRYGVLRVGGSKPRIVKGASTATTSKSAKSHRPGKVVIAEPEGDSIWDLVVKKVNRALR